MKRVTFKVSFSSLITPFISLWLRLKIIFNRFFQLPSGKEPISLTSTTSSSRAAGSEITAGSSTLCDKKKPFARPFSKGRLDGAPTMASPTPNETNNLLRQNHELRQRLQDESSNYRRRLDTYKQAQSNQSALVSRLQAKVMQYKQRCGELEMQMHDTTIPVCPSKLTTSSQICAGSSGGGGGSGHLPTTTASTNSAAQLSLPLCPELKPPVTYCSDESDTSFERKKSDEERKLWVKLLFIFFVFVASSTWRK